MRRPNDEQKIDVFMPLFIGDYLASTSHLTAVEHGAYLLLLMHQWKNGHLPAEEELLRRIARVEKDAWSSAYAVLSPFFRIADDGRPYQARLEKEREICLSLRQSKSDHGKRAANSRWHSQNDASAMLEHSRGSAPAVPGDATQIQTQTQTHIKEEDKKPMTASPEGSSVAEHVTPSAPEEFIYCEYPRKEGRRAAIKQIELAVVRLQRGESPLKPLSKRDAQEFIFKRVRAYAQSSAGMNPDKTKIPHPKTWFGQSRYLDDAANWQIVSDNVNGGSCGNRNTQGYESRAEIRRNNRHNAIESVFGPLIAEASSSADAANGRLLPESGFDGGHGTNLDSPMARDGEAVRTIDLSIRPHAHVGAECVLSAAGGD